MKDMRKIEFEHRLHSATESTYLLAKEWLVDTLPVEIAFDLNPYDDPKGSRAPEGKLKFFGGRFLSPDDLLALKPWEVIRLLWVDGRVPAWINLSVCSIRNGMTIFHVAYCRTLLPWEQAISLRDFGVGPENEYAPFRIRGPKGPYETDQHGPVRFPLRKI